LRSADQPRRTDVACGRGQTVLGEDLGQAAAVAKGLDVVVQRSDQVLMALLQPFCTGNASCAGSTDAAIWSNGSAFASFTSLMFLVV